MTLIQKLAVAYALMFFAVVGLNYLPFIHDENGMMFGLFSLQWYDDVLHGFSGIWALVAAFLSYRASVLYFRLFGSVYLFDGVLGLVTGSGCLDGGIFYYGFQDIEFATRFFANLPHLLIGGIAVFIGFVLARRSTGGLAPA
ncbi:MAG: hypothetical protein KF723_08640 [Rhizobiaceae bacterium]|nr:hypothetical protein [Rhizobiaceae bacterium]